MEKSPIKKTTSWPQKSAAILLLITIADTTWRAFVPTIGGTLLGVLLDNILKAAPLYTIIMIILGFATSGILIALQIRSVRKNQ